MCHIMFTLLCLIRRGEGNGSGVSTVHYVVSTFVRAKSLDIFIKTSGQFPNVLMARRPDIFEEMSADFPAVLVVTKQGKTKNCKALTYLWFAETYIVICSPSGRSLYNIV